jgi:hypothetical protein
LLRFIFKKPYGGMLRLSVSSALLPDASRRQQWAADFIHCLFGVSRQQLLRDKKWIKPPLKN